jgi:hypothetical protein
MRKDVMTCTVIDLRSRINATFPFLTAIPFSRFVEGYHPAAVTVLVSWVMLRFRHASVEIPSRWS